MGSLSRRDWLKVLQGLPPPERPSARSFLEDFYAHRSAATVPVALHPTTLYYDDLPDEAPESAVGGVAVVRPRS